MTHIQQLVDALSDLIRHHAIERYIEFDPDIKKSIFRNVFRNEVISEDDKSYRARYVKVDLMIRRCLINEHGQLDKEQQYNFLEYGYTVTIYPCPHRYRHQLHIETGLAIFVY